MFNDYWLTSGPIGKARIYAPDNIKITFKGRRLCLLCGYTTFVAVDRVPDLCDMCYARHWDDAIYRDLLEDKRVVQANRDTEFAEQIEAIESVAQSYDYAALMLNKNWARLSRDLYRKIDKETLRRKQIWRVI